MRIRPYIEPDLPRLVALTVETFGPFYEQHFRPLVGETVFAHQHGAWREDYRAQVPTLHDPAQRRWVAVAADGEEIRGYVAWNVDPARRHGEIHLLAVAGGRRRARVGTALCEHAFGEMREQGVEVVTIGTGGDAFHAPARALYASLGCAELPTAVFYKQL